MGRSCSVHGCKNGYYGKPTGSIYRFPKDPKELIRWLNALPQPVSPVEVTKNMAICSHHFPPGVKMRVVQGGKQVPVEPPSVFDNLDTSLPPRNRPIAVHKTEDLYSIDRISITTFNYEFKKRYSNLSFSMIEDANSVTILSKERVDSVFNFSLFLHKERKTHKEVFTSVEAYRGLEKIQFEFLVDNSIEFWTELDHVIKLLADDIETTGVTY